MSKFQPFAFSNCDCPPLQGDVCQSPKLKQVYLELTPVCNSRCPGCLNESFIADFTRRALKETHQTPVLNWKKWREILSALPETLESVILSGGEPTLHPKFLEIVQDIESQGPRFVIFTNGRWPKPDDLLETLNECSHFEGFLFSLHGATAETHEAFCGAPGSFVETVQNIRLATRRGFPVSLTTVITRQNLVELERMPALALELGARRIGFNRFNYTPERLIQTDIRIAPPNPLELQAAIRKVDALRSEYEGKIYIRFGPTIPQCFEPSSSRGCSAGETSFVIDPWGDVKPCLHTDLLCGNILEQGFEAVWESDRLNMWRKMLNEQCAGCSALSLCGGGCRAMTLAWGEQRDPLMRQPLIPTEQISFPQIIAPSVV